MKRIKVKTPAKINLTLEVLNKRQDGFHNIKSIMQTISLYDFLTFELSDSKNLEITLKGNSGEIPYDEKNIVYKAAKKFFEVQNINNVKLSVIIDKHIPVAAGLAGGSADAAGALFGLNRLFNNVLNNREIENLCSGLGSDLNFCLAGGCRLCTSRGEITEKLPFFKHNISLIKPKGLKISAEEAYQKFSKLTDKSVPDNTERLKKIILNGGFDKTLMYNSLENALFPYYKELAEIKNNVKNSLMSGSGPVFFVLDSKTDTTLDRTQYDIFENLITTDKGAEETDD